MRKNLARPYRVLVRERRTISRAFWGLSDQGIVSLGNFIVTILLARNIPIVDYGEFALFLSFNFFLQLICSALLLYPFSIRRHSSEDRDPVRLMSGTIFVAAMLAVVLSLSLAVILRMTSLGHLIPSAVAAYCIWQIKEAVRRCLHATFRFSATAFGEAVNYTTLIVVIGVLSFYHLLTLHLALLSIAASSAIGLLIHLTHVKLVWLGWHELRDIAVSSFRIGKWALFNEQVSFVRTKSVLWGLAYFKGPASVALLQAAMNLATLINPIIIGLGSNLPQIVAEAGARTNQAKAFRAARNFALVGALPILIYSGAVLAAPEFLLGAVYGSASPYIELAYCAQILIVAWVAHYVSEMMMAILFGFQRLRGALLNNFLALFAALLAIPLIIPFGVQGACIAIAFANCVRIPLTWLLLRQYDLRDSGQVNSEARCGPAA